MELISNSPEKTQSLAGRLVRELAASKIKQTKGARVIALVGELGAGKTTFIQGISKALGIQEKVLSPTFLIMRRFSVPSANLAFRKTPFQVLYHLDFYRLNEPAEMLDLGYDEILGNNSHLVVIEWADRFKKLIPKDAVWVKLEWLGEEKRKIAVS